MAFAIGLLIGLLAGLFLGACVGYAMLLFWVKRKLETEDTTISKEWKSWLQEQQGRPVKFDWSTYDGGGGSFMP
jgi:hypothetical protein